MKTFKQTPRVVFVEDTVHQLNSDIKKSHQTIIQTSVLLEARSYADKNLPKPDESNVDPYLTSIGGQYKALKKEVSVKLQGSLQRFLGVTGIAPLDEKIRGTIDAISKESDKIKNLEADKSRIQSNSKRTGYKKFLLILAFIAIAECLFTVSSFLKLGDIFIIALIVGVMVGVAQVAAARQTVLTIREIENPQKQKRYWIIALICFLIESICLGILRYYLAHQGVASDIPFIALNPLTFAVINMLFIVAAGLIVYFYFPTKAEHEQLNHIEEIEKDITQSAKLKGNLIKQYDELVADKVKAVKIHGELVHCEKELFEKIDAFYDEAVGKFKHENVTKRTDGAFPECFKQGHCSLPVAVEKEFILLTN
ncbi:MAG: hypothetical protein U9R46_13775 [Bacteroidota bacterium]|nr:hypothetical protein [Bacteroidota bacterium]